MDFCDALGGGSEIRPSQSLELVGISGVADLLEKKEAVGAAVGRSPGMEAWGQLPAQRSKQAVGGKFPGEYPEGTCPNTSGREVAADLQDVASGVAFARGEKYPTEKTG